MRGRPNGASGHKGVLWALLFVRRTPAFRDALVLSGLFIGLVTFFDIGRLFIELADLSRDYEGFGVDDVLGGSIVLILALAIFSYRRMLDSAREVRARRAAEQVAHNLARHDPLTGLPNRRFFSEKLAHALTVAKEGNRKTAIFMIDLNGFKPFNDIYGHPAGDQALIEFAGRVSGIIGKGVTLARVGGDEFAIIMPDVATPDDPTWLARRVLATLTEPMVIFGAAVWLRIGIGIALAPEDGTTPDELVRRADRALYRAKADGALNVCFFEPQMDAHMERRMGIEQSLRAALLAKTVVPHYQPLVSLDDNRIIGFEALARWDCAEFGPIGPSLFIPIAEECGLIGELSDQILRQACLDASTWPSDLKVAVNLSAVQLRDETLGLRIMSILAETGLSPLRLELELTESAVIDNLDQARRIIDDLRQTGIRIALDDFGTGYATLGQLRTLRLDKLKVDRSFVDRVCKDPEDLIIVRAILGLADGFALTTLAEGIEDLEQLACLRDNGCQEGQGFLFGKAVPAGEVLSLIERGPVAAAA
jgi:diguanylate cyclase (GGDEF)-like protein